MKETLEDLKTRRSCRNYRNEQIKDEELNAKTMEGFVSAILENLKNKAGIELRS